AIELNGKIYISGGFEIGSSGYSAEVNCIYVYDPAANTFTKMAARIDKGQFQGAFQQSGKIYFLPKIAYYDNSNLIEIYNPSKDEWSIGDQPICLPEDCCTAVLNNNAYIIGGYLSTYSNAVQRYSPNETLVYNDFTNYYGYNIPGQQKWSNIGVERLNGYTQNDYKLKFDGKDVLTLELNTNGYKDLILEYSSCGFMTSSGTFNVEVNPNIADPTKWTSIATYSSLQNEWIKKYHNLSADLENKPRIGIRFRFDKNTMDGVVAMLQYIKVYGRNSGLAPTSSALKTQFVNERFTNGASSKWALSGCNASTGTIDMDNSDTATCTFSTKGYKNITIQYNVNYYASTPSTNRLNVLANSTPSDSSKFAVVDSIPYSDFFGNNRKTDLGSAFDNMDSVQVKFALNQTTATDTGSIFNFIVTGEPIKTNVFSDLGVYDLAFNYDCTANDYGWFLQSGLSTGSYLFGDKQITATSIPSSLLGAEWISPSYNSRMFTGSNLATVKTNAYADVFIAYDDRLTSKPSWFTGWTDTGMDIKFDDGGAVTYSVFKKSFTAGSTINLGPNSIDPDNSWNYDQYIVLAKPVIMSELSVKDTSNTVDWSLQLNPTVGSTLFGDRVFTITTLPSILNGAEWIRVANDSKAYTGSPLATFKVNSTADIFIAYDDRITTKPSWFTGWTDTGTDIKDNQSTPITYSVFKKTVIGGSTVTLGPNGNTTYCLYSVFAKPVTIMSNLTVNDTANEMDWSIR
ncbi:MAG: hypothetical protein Q8942_20060, partial [Bacillota bacterium]|nr:hypothetical protein [Bacillota bacterium]